MKDRDIILIPGAFNPPTIAHIQIGNILHRVYPDSYIFYLPSRDEYITGWKQQAHPISYYERAKLLEDNVYDGIDIIKRVSYIEYKEITTGKTYDVVNWYRNNNADKRTVMVCLGEDKLKELPRWYNYEKLVSENKFIIMTRDKSRDTFPLELLPYMNNFEFLDFNYPDISSTKIREAYLSGQLDTVREFIPQNVYEYLQTHNDLFKEVDANV